MLPVTVEISPSSILHDLLCNPDIDAQPTGDLIQMDGDAAWTTVEDRMYGGTYVVTVERVR